jgi:hypothetical protein
MTTSKAIKNLRNQRLIVTPRFEQYMLTHDGINLSSKTAATVSVQMTSTPRERHSSFSCSSAGRCHRQQAYGFLGYPSHGPSDPRVNLLFLNGHYVHIMCQAVMLDAGIIDTMEDPVSWPRKFHRGTMDGSGIVPDDHPIEAWRGMEFLLEVKGLNDYGFTSSVRNDSPSIDYKRQVSKYMVVSGIDLVSFFYVNKNTQATHEWVFTRSDLAVYINEAKDEIEALAKAVDTNTLPARKPGAKNWLDAECQLCPFSGDDNVCMNVTDWTPHGAA